MSMLEQHCSTRVEWKKRKAEIESNGGLGAGAAGARRRRRGGDAAASGEEKRRQQQQEDEQQRTAAGPYRFLFSSR